MAKHLQITDIDTTDDMPASKGYVDTEVAGAGGGASVLDDLTDVVISTPSNGQVLKYDSGTSKWVNGTDATGGAGSLSDGDYGDITVSGTGTVMNIDAGVVTTTELGGDITTAGKALLDDADAAAQLTTLGLTATATELNYTDGVTSSIQTQLDGKASSSHTHTSSNITDFDEAVEDKIGAKVSAGTGISVSYNDTTGVTTVSSTAGDVYTTVGSSGASYTTVGDAITAGATKIAVITDVTEAGSITIPADGVLIGLNQSIEVTMPSGGNVTIEDRAKMSEISIVLDTGKVVLNDSSSATRTVLSKSSSTGYILEFAGQSGKFVDGRIYDTATPLSTSRVVIRKYDCHFESNYCEITDAGTTTGTAWLRTSNVSGDTGASHVITGNYFFAGAAGVKTTWSVDATLVCCQYADGVISENNFDGSVSRGIAIVMEDYHESISDNYFNAFETQLVLTEITGSMSSDTYRTEVVGNKFAQPSGRNVYCSGYGNSFVGNTFSCTNQTLNFNPSTSSSTKGRGNHIIGGQIRSGNVIYNSNTQDNYIIGVTFLNSASVTDSGTNNYRWMNSGISDNYSKTSTFISDFNEAAQDAVGNALVDGTTIDFTYNDAGNTITAERAALTGDVTASAGSNSTTIANSAVTNAKMADMANSTVKGNVSGSTAAPSDLTATQLTTLINPFTTSLSGAAPASGGGTTNFLRADGTWAAPTASTAWGSITGTLSSQTDLNTALDAKVDVAGDTFTGSMNTQTLLPSTSATYDLGSATFRYNALHLGSLILYNASAITFSNGSNMILGTTTGTKIGTATTQKLGFFNATPIVQPTGNIPTALTNLGLVATPTIAQSDVTNLTTDLAGKASSTHTHTASEVTDFSEAVDDRVSALLTAGSNITLTYNDAANTLTIDASGGGSGLTHPEIMARISMGF